MRTCYSLVQCCCVQQSRVIHVTSEQPFKELIGKGKATKRSAALDFTATWCGPFRYISPVYRELSANYPCTTFLKVDVDELKSVSRGYGVTAMPTFQFFRSGVKCDEMRGADKNGLETRIQEHYVEVELPDDEKPVVLGATAGKTEDSNASGEGQRQRNPQVTIVDMEEQWEKLIQQNQESNKAVRDLPLVGDFWVTWCKPCLEIAPLFEDLSGRFPVALFARVDVDRLEAVAEEYNVSSLPSFKVFNDGKVVDELSEAIKTALESMVAKHASN